MNWGRARRLLKDPLLHFLAGGGLLFALFALIHGSDTTGTEGGRTIVVDRRALITAMQYQSAAFEPKRFAALYAALPTSQKQALVDSYVREEALVREARAMGLDQGDYVIRRRLVQKMMYLMDDAATQTFSPSDAELQRYFRAHQDAYRAGATVTFTHVYLDGRTPGAEQAAARLKAELEAKRAGFDAATGYGDRFPYLRNYVQRTPDFVASQFGAPFTAGLMQLKPSTRWQGPIRSELGWHVVLLTDVAPASLPRFAEVRAQVKEDMLRDVIGAYREKAVLDLERRFKVKAEDLAAGPMEASAPMSDAASLRAYGEAAIPGD
jgi:hypothetical protein